MLLLLPAGQRLVVLAGAPAAIAAAPATFFHLMAAQWLVVRCASCGHARFLNAGGRRLQSGKFRVEHLNAVLKAHRAPTQERAEY